ncbi:hypothetical protein GF366_02450 [Candidatus Peregrinibacteria bacterium]|nr:hypothetical protein [Candidatus Peregrinibacteria bacterium]
MWGSFSVLILSGGIVTSVIIFRLKTNDWEIYKYLGYTFPGFIIKTLPYFWILLLVIFIGIAFYNFRHTSKGYHYKFAGVVGISVIASIVLGFAFFGMGVAGQVEDLALHRMPFYDTFSFQKRIEKWKQVDKGIVAGEIIEIMKDEIKIKDLSGELRTLNIKDIPPKIKRTLKKEMIIGVIGEKLKDGNFRADKLRPWKGNYKKMRPGAFYMKEKYI